MRIHITLLLLLVCLSGCDERSETKAPDDMVSPATVDSNQNNEEILLKAAKQGNGVAQLKLGFIYQNGSKNLKQDFKKAVYWYKVAAKQENPEIQAQAHFLLCMFYGGGHGVPQDYAQAYMHVSLAAEQGHQEAVQLREVFNKKLTPKQISEGQRLMRQWQEDQQKQEN